MPSPGESQKGYLSVVFTTLLLLIPGSLAMRMTLGSPNQTSSAKASDRQKPATSEDADSADGETAGPADRGTSAETGPKSAPDPATEMLARYCPGLPHPATATGPTGGGKNLVPGKPTQRTDVYVAVAVVPERSLGTDATLQSIVRAVGTGGTALTLHQQAAETSSKPAAQAKTPPARLPNEQPPTAPLPVENQPVQPVRSARAEPPDPKAYCADAHVMLALVPERSMGVDGALESLVRAFETADYTLARVTQPATKSGKPDSRPKIPSALLFSRPRQGAPGAVEVQLVLLVQETPNQGPDEASLRSALKLWAELEPLQQTADQPPRELRILGPMYSGSAQRLGWLLGSEQVEALSERVRIRVLSGSATNAAYGLELRQGFARARGVGLGIGPQIEINTTVRSDDDMMQALWHYLTQRLHAQPKQIALVVESSTGYGQAVDPRQGNDTPFAGSLILPVPLGLGHIKSEWEKQGRGKQPETTPEPHKTLAHVEPPEASRGLLPLFDRRALNRRDLMLSALLNSICQEGIEYVGILLTNAEDKSFLAERVMLECPDVRLFSTESDIGYLHHEHYRTLRGMLIASTYPLYSRNAQWSFSNIEAPNKRMQFPSQADQGLYNAALLLLNQGRRLQEYAMPSFQRRARLLSTLPPVWISAVARDGMMPLFAAPQPRLASTASTQLHPAPSEPPSGGTPLPKYTPYDLGILHGLLLLLSLAALLHGFAYFRNQHGRPLWVSKPFEMPRYFDVFQRSQHAALHDANDAPGYHMFVMISMIFISLSYLTLALTLRFRPSNLVPSSLFNGKDWSFFEDIGYSLAAVAGLSALFLTIVDIAVRQSRDQRIQRKWHSLALRISLSGPLTALVLTLVSCAFAVAIYFFNAAIESDVFLVLFLRRSSQTTFEMSLLVPALFLCLIGYVWGLFNLRRMSHVRSRFLQTPAGMSLGPAPTPQRAGHRHPRHRHSLQELLHALPLHYWVGMIVATAVALLPVLRRLTTLDHWLLSWVFRASIYAAALAVVASMVRLVRSWYLLREQLHLAAHHPISGVLKSLDGAKEALLAPLGSLLLDSLSRYSERTYLSQQCRRIETEYQALDDAQRRALGLVPVEGRLLPWQRIQRDAAALAVLPGEAPTPRDDANADDASVQPSPDAEIEALLRAQQIWPPADGSASPPRASKDQPAPLWTALEQLLALRLVIYLHHVVVPLREALMFVSINLILLLLALNSYPFQPRDSIGVFIWISFLSAITLSGHVLLQMNRDPILSHVAGGEQGKLRWDSTFGRQFLLFVLAPLLTLLASKIPSLGWLPSVVSQLPK